MSSTSLMILNAVLAVMMFGIALSLTTADFARVMTKPLGPLVGLCAQFILLPGLTCLLTWFVPMPSEVALGLLLVSCCPGGSFSNVMTYLSKGNTALSVSMTGVASLLACVLTPLNFMFYAALNPRTQGLLSSISVSVTDILTVVALVLALPLALGLVCATRFPLFAKRADPFFRIFSLVTLFCFVLIALAMNWQKFISGASVFLFAVVAHNLLALVIGWVTAWALKLPVSDRRAITLEVGLQNSGLGLGIIFTFFADFTSMAIIAAAWGIWHLISGTGLTLTWQWLDRISDKRVSLHAIEKGPL